MSKKITYFLLYFFILNGFSQNQKKIDSLSYLINFFKTKDNIQDSVKVNLCLKLCKEYNIVNPREQLVNADIAYTISKKINFTKGIGLASYYRTRAYNDIGNYDIAIKHAPVSVAIFSKLKDNKNLGDAYFGFAQSYIFKTNYPLSIFYLNKAINFHEKAKDQLGWARDYNNLGLLYMKQSKYPTALKCFNKVISVLSRNPSEDGNKYKNLVQSNVAYVYQSQNQHELAITLLIDCRKKDSIAGKMAGVAFNSVQIGNSYIMLKKNKLAHKYLSESEQLFLKMENYSALADNYRFLGMNYYSTGKIHLAEKYTLKGLDISKKIGELESMKYGYEQLAKIYQYSKKYELALENQILYKTISDSIMNTEINNKVTQIQMTYEFEKKQKTIEEIQKKKETILKEETQKQRNIKYTISVILIVLSLFTFGIYKNLKRNQKQKDIIENQNAIIQQSLTEKEVLLREIHHRVKNNLQIISSLLNIQSEDIQDEKIVASLQEGKSRVEAMSLIHQNLYQSEHINNVAIDNYLIELTQYISDLFSKNNNKISTQVLTSNYHFDIDTAIPLGLIINELVTNAYKYAFVNKEEGEIKISIEKIADREFKLEVTDNGIGLPENFDIKKTKSLGLSLVSILSRQLRGKLETHSQKNKTTFTVFFKETEII